MKSHFSLYIHLIRIFAAVGVFLAHLSLNYFSNIKYFSDENGHYCVIIFFVLSGYLIAYTHDVKKKSALEYSVDRLSRLYSVVFPALVITYLFDGIGRSYNAEFYKQFINPDFQLIKFAINLLHSQQIVFFNTNPSSNVAFWSLSYEFWYYVFYGCAIFLKGKTRIVFIVLVIIVMGIKILTLLPVWLTGVAAYYLTKKWSFSTRHASLMFLMSFFVLFVFFFYNIRPFPDFWKLGFPPLYYSSYFPNDYVYGILIAFNILSLSFVRLELFVVPPKLNDIIKYLSSATFPLYAIHYPLLVFVAAMISYDRGNVWHVTSIIVGVLILILFLNYYLDKSHKYYVSFFVYLFFLIKKKG